MTTQLLFLVGTLPFISLGVAHLVLTARDEFRPRHLAPRDAHVQELMVRTTLKLTGRTTVWKAWLGFNFSHALGLVFFGVVLLLIAVYDFELVLRLQPLLLLAIVVAAVHVLLAIRYWFAVPALGAAVGLICFLLAALIAWTR
jgi:hypothetical protein